MLISNNNKQRLETIYIRNAEKYKVNNIYKSKYV